MKINRKERDSKAHQKYYFHIPKERASVFTSRPVVPGSITLEAAFSSAFFFFGVLCLVYLLEIMAIETTIKSGLCSVGKNMARQAYVNPIISSAAMEQEMVEIIGRERLDKSILVNGSSGIDCSKSKRQGNTTIMNLSASYRIEIPVLIFRIPIISREETIRIKGWTGEEFSLAGSVEDEMVYVTDYGIVYHTDRNCTYLNPSIKMAREKTVGELRNASGARYQLCESCKKKKVTGGMVYVTDYGTRYHNSIECSGLTRKIYRIPLSDAHGLGGCSKCVK